MPLLRVLLEAYPEVEDYHLFHLATCADLLGDSMTATAAAKQLLDHHDRSVYAAATALAWGQRLRRTGDDLAAEPLLRRASAAHRTAIARRARFELAEIDLTRGRVRRAYDIFASLREGGVGSEVGERSKAYIRDLRRKYPELRPNATAREAEIDQLIQERDYSEAFRINAAALATSNTSQRPRRLRTRARIELASGDSDQYLRTLRQLHETYPGSPVAPEALYQEARWYWNRDSDIKARAIFREFQRRYPSNRRMRTVRYALARIAQGQRDHTSAIRGFREVTKRYPHSVLAAASKRQIAWLHYRQGRWDAAARAFASLARGRSVARSADTIYWRGRALEHAGNPRYRSLYESILERAPDSYYAALAASRLGEDTAFAADHVTRPVTPFPALPPELTDDYHLTRARELHRAQLIRLARREVRAFNRSAANLPRDTMIALYRAVDAHRDAIRLAARNRDLYEKVLYPLAFWELVKKSAYRYRIDPLLALSLMRQESLFDPDAQSPANARGLMQLLPSTAADVAARIGRSGHIDLREPATNIELGTAYLRELADKYDGDHVRILAAYNAGTAAVAKWDRRSGDRPRDEYIEAISYGETRNYVKKVLANYRKYRRLYGSRTTADAAPTTQG